MNSFPQTLEDFYSGATPFVQLFDAFAKKHRLVGRVQADHICYRCESGEVFESIRTLFEPKIPYLYQAKIAERRIAIIKLPSPIATLLGPIYFLELSDQKLDGSQTNRYDHIEAYPVGWSYEDMVAELGQTETIKKFDRPHHSTHDIALGNNFLFRCTHELLIDKIKREEMI